MTRAPANVTRAHHLAIEAARGRLSTVVDSVQEQPVLLTRRGRPVAAVITIEQYELLLVAEGVRDGPRSRHGSSNGDPSDEATPSLVDGGDLG